MSGDYFRNMNQMQEKVIGDLVKLMRGNVCELSLYYINSTRQMLNWCKDPEGMLEGTGHVPITSVSNFS